MESKTYFESRKEARKEIEQLREDETFQYFLMERDIRESTEEKYLIKLHRYTKFTGLSLSELIQEADEDEEQHNKMKYRRITKRLSIFKKHLQDEGKSPTYITTLLTTIRNFYRTHEISTPETVSRTSSTTRNKEKEASTKDEIPSKKDIKEALKRTNIKYRAIILLMSSSGMGIGEITHLKLSDYLKSLGIQINRRFDVDEVIEKLKNETDALPTWSIRRYKTAMPYYTFSSPESVKAINTYLIDRINRNSILKPEDPLFGTHGKPITSGAMTKQFERINNKCGFGKYGRVNFFRSHALRKFFASTLIDKDIDPLKVDWLLGHSIPTTREAYFKKNVDSLKELYIKTLPALSIDKVDIEKLESDKIKELEAELENTKLELDLMKTQYDETMHQVKDEIMDAAMREVRRVLVEKHLESPERKKIIKEIKEKYPQKSQ